MGTTSLRYSMTTAAHATIPGDAYRTFGFRYRVFIFLLLYLLGFTAPWERSRGSGTFWLAASTWIARSGWMGLATATLTVTLIALACLALGTLLRVWGTAYLGSAVMLGSAHQGDQLVAAGPYRFVRNPLYLGSWLLALGVSILMPPGGAVFFLPALTLFVIFLISAEEHFLSATRGEVYAQYRRRVPRLLPRIGGPAAASSTRPHWLQAIFAETYPVSFTLCFAIFAWRYNARILIQCLLIGYGLSLLARAFARAPQGKPT